MLVYYVACEPPSLHSFRFPKSEQIEQLKKQLQWAELKIQVLEERLRLELIAKYGPASEKLSDAQLELSGTGAWSEQRRSPGGE